MDIPIVASVSDKYKTSPWKIDPLRSEGTTLVEERGDGEGQVGMHQPLFPLLQVRHARDHEMRAAQYTQQHHVPQNHVGLVRFDNGWVPRCEGGEYPNVGAGHAAHFVVHA